MFDFVADVFGTLEALTKIINMYNDSRCPLDIVEAAVGPVTEEDVDIAQMFNGTRENRRSIVNFVLYFSHDLRFQCSRQS